MSPYYSSPGVQLFLGDARAVVPLLRGVDSVLTDPPYGIGAGQMNLGKWRTSKMLKTNWDDATVDLSMIVGLGVPSIIWGGNYFTLPPSRGFLLWDKGAGFRGRDFAECEQAWCSFDCNARILTYDPLAKGDYRTKQHPTQKPVAVMQWCLSFLEGDTVLDCFAGSGTTGVACIQTGRQFIGIELEERYAEIAANRLRHALNEGPGQLPFAANDPDLYEAVTP